MGIKDLKKYDLSEIIKGDSIFSATGITSGDLVKGINVQNDKYITETLVTHKAQKCVKFYKGRHYKLDNIFYNESNLVSSIG